jgi:hypothetical protein
MTTEQLNEKIGELRRFVAEKEQRQFSTIVLTMSDAVALLEYIDRIALENSALRASARELSHIEQWLSSVSDYEGDDSLAVIIKREFDDLQQEVSDLRVKLFGKNNKITEANLTAINLRACMEKLTERVNELEAANRQTEGK